jgi:hypothetical protein
LYSSDPALTSAIVTSEVPVSSASSLTTTSQLQIQTITAGSRLSGIVFDSSGNYYVTGRPTADNMLIIKFNSSGVIEWQRTINTGNAGNGIAVDSFGNVYVTGATSNSSYTDMITVKYNSLGTLQWQSTINSAYTSLDVGSGIAINSFGSVYVVGTVYTTIGSNRYMISIVKYDANGNLLWQRGLDNGSTDSTGYGIAIDSSNNYYINGYTGSNIITAKYDSSDNIVWQRTLTGTGTDVGYGIAVDSSGNAYITGFSNSADIIIAKYDTSGTMQWQKSLASASTEYGSGIAVDGSGNVYIVGYSTNSFNDIIIAKYDTSGTIQWQRTLTQASTTDFGIGVAINSSGNVYITGYNSSNGIIAKIPSDGGTAGTYGSFTYSASSLTSATSTLTASTSTLSTLAPPVTSSTSSLTSSTSTLTSTSPLAIQTLASAGGDSGNGIAIDSSGSYYITGNTGTDILIAKYNSSGVIQWQRTLASSGTDVGYGIAVDNLGNVYIVGSTNNASTDDIIIAKYNTSGTLLWQTILASANSDSGRAIAVDSSGNVYITGYSLSGSDYNLALVKYNSSGAIQWQRIFSANSSLPPSVAVDSSDNVYFTGASIINSSQQLVVAKYNTSGALIWQKKLTGNNGVSGFKIAVDSSSNLYVGGYTSSTFYYPLITKYDANGNLQWQRTLAGANGGFMQGFASDSSGNVYIAIGWDNYYGYVPNSNQQDIVIAKYDTSGNLQWQFALGTNEYQSAGGIVVDSSGSVYVTGYSGANSVGDVIIAKIPSDGGTAGTYGAFKYATSTLTSATSTLAASTPSPLLSDSDGTLVPDKGVWISTFGASGSSLESSNGIALDSAKNIYTIGKTLHTSGTTDSLLVKYNNSGTMQWQRTLTGSNSNDSGNGIAIDSSDNIYTVGTTGSNANDIVISKYNTSGVIQWQAILGTGVAQTGNGIAVDSSGNVYVTGSILDGGSYTDAMVAKYNSSGSIVWQRYVRGQNSSVGNGIIVDSSGNVYVTGKTILTGSGLSMFIAKYTNSGTFSWAKTPNADYTDESFAISIDTSDNLYIAGFWGSYTSPYNPDAYIAKFDSSGTFQWQKGTDTASIIEKLFGIDVDSFGNSYTCGTTGTDILIIKYDSSGTILWSRSLTGTSTTDIGYGIQVDGDYVYITGSTSTGAKSLIAKLPNDGSYTGTYGSFTYSTLSLSSASLSLSASTSNLNSFTPTLTSSLILSSTDLNASSVNNYLK